MCTPPPCVTLGHEPCVCRDEVFFLTGTDEHGVKVEQSARQGVDPQALADLNSGEFRKAMELFDLTNDEFIDHRP